MQASRYQIIWNTLKKDKTIRLSAPAEAHRRLKKAIIKRKDIDIGYKLMASESNLRPYLEFSSSGNILTVTLHTPYRSDYL